MSKKYVSLIAWDGALYSATGQLPWKIRHPYSVILEDPRMINVQERPKRARPADADEAPAEEPKAEDPAVERPPGRQIPTLLDYTSAAMPGSIVAAPVTFTAASFESGAPLALYPGAYVVVAASSGGKTRATRALLASSSAPAEYHSWGEPVAESWAPHPSTFAQVIDGSMAGGASVVAIDSMKWFLTSSAENVGKGGLSKAVLNLLDSLGRAAERIGLVLILPVNVLDLSDVDLKGLTKALQGATSGVILLESVGAESASGEVTWRRGDRAWRKIVIRIPPSQASNQSQGSPDVGAPILTTFSFRSNP